jgi:hypothetical protein
MAAGGCLEKILRRTASMAAGSPQPFEKKRDSRERSAAFFTQAYRLSMMPRSGMSMDSSWWGQE